MGEQIKKLHLDFDETLISSLYVNNEEHADQLIETYGQHWAGWKYSLCDGAGWNYSVSWYVTFIRSWTREFLEWCYETYGRDNVHFLTMGTADYIFKMIQVLELDIDIKNVHTREDIHYPRHNFDSFNNVLVDNENYQYHSFGNGLNKVNFLSVIPPQKLVEIDDFDVRYFKPELDDGYVEHVKKEIIKAFDWKNES